MPEVIIPISTQPEPRHRDCPAGVEWLKPETWKHLVDPHPAGRVEVVVMSPRRIAKTFTTHRIMGGAK